MKATNKRVQKRVVDTEGFKTSLTTHVMDNNQKIYSVVQNLMIHSHDVTCANVLKRKDFVKYVQMLEC